MTGRVLCLDPGLRQIGAALSDELRLTVSEYGSFAHNRAFWPKLKEICDSERVSLIVIGRPLQMDGSETDQTKWAEAFAERVKEVAGLPVELEAETGSSKEAAQGLRGESDGDIHASAARVILEGYLAPAR